MNINTTNSILTLGGALTLRQECEILAKENSINIVNVKFSENFDATFKNLIWRVVFESSNLSFKEVQYSPPYSIIWPLKDDDNLPFHSFSRINILHQNSKTPICLDWKSDIVNSALSKVPFKGDIIGLHLKNVFPYDKESSNVVWEVWEEFLKDTFIKYPKLNFLIMGDDQVKPSVMAIKNVTWANDISLSLREQLALVQYFCGFIGLASGICSAANFSRTPYVIIKHPNHHQDEMLKDLGEGDTFQFSSNAQFLWREVQSIEVLNKALDVIMFPNDFKK